MPVTLFPQSNAIMKGLSLETTDEKNDEDYYEIVENYEYVSLQYLCNNR